MQETITAFLAQKRADLEPLGADIDELLSTATEFLQGGKRFRAYCLALGFLARRRLNLANGNHPDVVCVVTAAAALEVFHAAALVHDDIIDRSATRRGKPAVHTRFSELHSASRWRGSASHFGIASAILLGDLLQSWADELMQQAIEMTSPKAGKVVRENFNRMRTDVVCGQYFDVLEEQYPNFAPQQLQLERATRVVIFKTAKYSVVEPLQIGAALAGGGETLAEELSNYGMPLGIAFQLRDDILGVFGDSEVTGKSNGDDLIAGKRTVLVTLAREKMSGSVLKTFDELFGNPNLTQLQLEMLQRTIQETGAAEIVEEMIAGNAKLATKSARSTEINADAVEPLVELVEKMTVRAA